MGANCQANLKKNDKERVNIVKIKDFYLIKFLIFLLPKFFLSKWVQIVADIIPYVIFKSLSFIILILLLFLVPSEYV